MPATASPREARQRATGLLKRLATIQRKEPKYTVGLDLGASSVKVVVLGARKSEGSPPILAQQVVALKPGQDVDASEALKAAVGNLPMPISTVNMAVSGQWVIMRIIEMPAMKDNELKQALPFEAQRYLPFNIQDVILDGAMLGPSEGKKVWVLIVACKKELVERRIDWAKRAGVNVSLIDVDALALANAFLEQSNGKPAEGTSALINVGSLLTNLVVFKGPVPYLVRDIPWGGERLIRHVGEQLGIEAEEIRQQLLKGELGAETAEAMKLAAESLVTELQLSFDYFENRFSQPPDKVLVTGGLSQSARFIEVLKGLLAQAVQTWAPAENLSGQFSIAYGLALRTDH
ncbi:MAG: pilus assembly protein PilM [Candidatus Omnitrophica bacterium]|nr:pilus assembly protein PilM [Candidatus Omnitrophota bacterium]